MDEVFGDENFVNEIIFTKTSGLSSSHLSSRCDYLLWYAKSKPNLKFRRPYTPKSREAGSAFTYNWIRNNC